MKKKAVWINPLTTGSTSLDIAVNPHDVDHLAVSALMERDGYEVWLQDPYRVKRMVSSYPRRLTPDQLQGFQADLAVMFIGPFCLDYLGHRYAKEAGTSRADRLDLITDWLDRHEGRLQFFIDDPRPLFQEVLLTHRGEHRLYDHIDRAELLVADPEFLHPDLRHRAVVTDYWKHVRFDPLPFDPTEDYFCVYPGMPTNDKRRRKQISSWFGDTEGCHTVGGIAVPGVPSLSDHKKVPLSEVLDLTRRSTTALVTGNPEHTWLTPRVLQSLCRGTIASFHPDFPARHHIPEEILRDQTFATAADFDRKLLSPEIYDRQLQFVAGLAETAPIVCERLG